MADTNTPKVVYTTANGMARVEYLPYARQYRAVHNRHGYAIYEDSLRSAKEAAREIAD